jgi:FecR protein
MPIRGKYQRPYRRYLSLTLLLQWFLLVIARSNLAFGQAPMTSQVTDVSGAVQIQRGTTTLIATPGMQLQVGDRIVTGSDGLAKVLFSDGSTLEIADSSNLVIDQHFATTTHLSVSVGRVRAFVNRTIGASTPEFEVHTPNAVAAARGTLFDVGFTLPATTNVSVSEGIVHLANINNLSGGIDVLAGYQSSVVGEASPTSPQPVSTTIFSLSFYSVVGGGAAAAGGLAAAITSAENGGTSGPPPVASPSQ